MGWYEAAQHEAELQIKAKFDYFHKKYSIFQEYFIAYIPYPFDNANALFMLSKFDMPLYVNNTKTCSFLFYWEPIKYKVLFLEDFPMEENWLYKCLLTKKIHHINTCFSKPCMWSLGHTSPYR